MWSRDRAWVPGLILGPGPSLNLRLGPPGTENLCVQFLPRGRLGRCPTRGPTDSRTPNDGQIEAEVRDGMNPRQRRAILLLALATLGLLGVFVLVAGYVADVRAQVDPKVDVLVLTKPAKANSSVTDDMVRTERVPRRWAPEQALTDRGALVNL